MSTAARRLGCRNICLFGGSRRVEYVRRLVNAVREEGRRYGMNVHVSGGHPGEHVDAEIVKSWKHHIRSVRKKFRPDAFLVDGFGHMELFQQALRELGFRPGGDVQVFCDSDPTPGAVLIRSDYTESSVPPPPRDPADDRRARIPLRHSGNCREDPARSLPNRFPLSAPGPSKDSLPSGRASGKRIPGEVLFREFPEEGGSNRVRTECPPFPDIG